ncbi:sugar ABC transporter substrate-binding protein [Isoptericola sp. b441]|uniref:Sugar ABC transporter substrate-binding protein n=1 Tax=Actinotalea lenta TaxID=3064654 RepID=A0ABT9D8M9_9CELL|nr:MULTISPECIES: multiple monosaccharide ABC transporter substrate-binding protein [unclassified Isoptericola]MDO8106614.1 sugar ABC transporter substrate-binding protein [Isoptericola sp. b441]MDO8121678.1 sugar ABC transporter substrate-binding protein [Isoptericola sp. b490]
MSWKWKRAAAGLAAASLLMTGLAACSSSRTDEGGAASSSAAASGDATNLAVGIAMPTRSLERWNKDGANLEKLLKDKGYTTNLQYADNKVDQQISQIQNMINEGDNILVIASIDGTALAPILQTAADQGIKVIAYDRLINGTPNVDYYATFDNYMVGQMQGKFIEDALDLKNQAGPFNIEPFAGSPDDNNAKFFFAGAWDVLLPYVQKGVLKVPSGKSPASDDEWQSIGIPGWASDSAQNEMTTRLNSFYAGGTKLDAVLSPNDSLALGIAQALEGAGYKPGPDYPVLTGQDGDKANVLNILAGKQSMTVWKDTRELAKRVATMVDEIATGADVEVNDTSTYNNGIKVVPTYLISPVVVTKDNVQDTLVASGFYSASDLGL